MIKTNSKLSGKELKGKKQMLSPEVDYALIQRMVHEEVVNTLHQLLTRFEFKDFQKELDEQSPHWLGCPIILWGYKQAAAFIGIPYQKLCTLVRMGFITAHQVRGYLERPGDMANYYFIPNELYNEFMTYLANYEE